MDSEFHCPGTKLFREPIPEDVPCPKCGKEVEIWTHELKATCRNCGAAIFRESKASCIDWCKYAKECVGEELYATLKEGKESHD